MAVFPWLRLSFELVLASFEGSDVCGQQPMRNCDFCWAEVLLGPLGPWALRVPIIGLGGLGGLCPPLQRLWRWRFCAIAGALGPGGLLKVF